MGGSLDFGTWDAWKKLHQNFELDWWRERLPDHCADPGFAEHWREVLEFVEPSGRVIDIGCGPRTPFQPCTVIDPLVNEYIKMTPPEWWDGVDTYAQPAEELISGLRGDTIVCWNALDHAVGWRTILDNMLAYGNPNARFAIATDLHEPFLGHPGFGPTPERSRMNFEAEVKKRFKVIDRREPLGRAVALLMTARV